MLYPGMGHVFKPSEVPVALCQDWSDGLITAKKLLGYVILVLSFLEGYQASDLRSFVHPEGFGGLKLSVRERSHFCWVLDGCYSHFDLRISSFVGRRVNCLILITYRPGSPGTCCTGDSTLALFKLVPSRHKFGLQCFMWCWWFFQLVFCLWYPVWDDVIQKNDHDSNQQCFNPPCQFKMF